MHLKNGAVLQGGRYRIEKLLGQGGFGITYLAIQSGLNRKVAIKEFFMKEHCNRDADTSHVSVPSIGSRELVEKFMAKFLKEAATIAAMENDHIVRIYDIFEENGTAYYVMEYLGEDNLQSRIPALGMPYQEAVGYIRQIAAALGYIHSQNILHLDIKPSNVLFRKGTDAVLIDFGVSKHYDAEDGSQTSSTPVGLSRGYAPLEQNKAGGVSQFTPSTDIYSLGATFYKLITGQTPPEADEVNENGLPAFPSSVPSEIASVIEKAMQPKRKDRPQSINEFLEILASAMRTIVPTQKDEPIDPDPVVIQPDILEAEPVVDPSDDKTSLENNAVHDADKPARPASESSSRTPQSSPKKKSRKWLWWLLALLVAVVGADAVLFMGKDAQPAGSSGTPSSQIEADQARSDAQTYSSLMEKGAEYEENDATLLKAKEKYSSAKELEEKWSQSKDYGSLFSQDATEALNRVEDKLKELEEAESRKKAAGSASLTGKHNGHAWVDLGLSVKWATCNVGASRPGDYGKYYAWGETTTKSTYTEDNCASYEKSWSDIGGDSSRDAARANWGGDWRLPTEDEFQELLDNCTCEWTTQNGRNGYMVTSKQNGQSIFLPAAAWRVGPFGGRVGSFGSYWSSTPNESRTSRAYFLSFDEDGHLVCWDSCSYGLSVRPVLE